MKKILAVAVLGAMGLALPLATAAQAEVTKKVIIKHGDRGHHCRPYCDSSVPMCPRHGGGNVRGLRRRRRDGSCGELDANRRALLRTSVEYHGAAVGLREGFRNGQT